MPAEISEMGLSLRPVAPGDLSGLTALYLRCFNGPPWNDGWSEEGARERLHEICDAPGFVGYVAFGANGPVGLALGQSERWVGGRQLLLQEMCVHPEVQRTGVGAALLAALSRELERRGIDHVYLLTARGGGAEAFYRREGFDSNSAMVVMAAETRALSNR